MTRGKTRSSFPELPLEELSLTPSPCTSQKGKGVSGGFLTPRLLSFRLYVSMGCGFGGSRQVSPVARYRNKTAKLTPLFLNDGELVHSHTEMLDRIFPGPLVDSLHRQLPSSWSQQKQGTRGSTNWGKCLPDRLTRGWVPSYMVRVVGNFCCLTQEETTRQSVGNADTLPIATDSHAASIIAGDPRSASATKSIRSLPSPCQSP